MNRFWSWVKRRFWIILGAVALLTGTALFVWWAYPSITNQPAVVETEETTSATSTLVVILVGLLVTGVLAYLVHKKFRENAAYRKNWQKKTKPTKQKESVASRQPIPEVPVVAKRKIRLGWVFGLSALVGVIFLSYFFDEAVEERLKDYLQDKDIGGLPILARSDPVSPEATLAIIAECESGGRQFDDEGNLIVHAESGAIGKYQILPSWHEEDAEKLGLDIRTEEGNEAFAKVLFERYGTEPWNASRHCWGEKVVAPYAKTFSGVTTATGTIRVGRGWSEWVRVPPGQELFIERMEKFAYEMEIQNGDVFEYPRDFRGHHRLPLLQRARFRVTDKEADELSIWLRFSEYKQ